VLDPCKVANATAIHGHREPVPCDCRPVSLVTIRAAKRWRWPASLLTPVPLSPWGGSPLFHHRRLLASRTPNREGGHGDLHHRMRVQVGRLMGQSLETTRAVLRTQQSWNTTTRLTHHGQRSTTYYSVFGKVGFEQSYVTPCGQEGCCPLDAELSLLVHRCCNLLREWAAYGATDES
jgi:hypothetical protein